MRLYFAGLYSTGFSLKCKNYEELAPPLKTIRENVAHILESYHYVHGETKVGMLRNDGIRVFLDSGAFSAHFCGIEIDLEKYCKYIKENEDIIEVASVLDGIGDPLKTYENQAKMEALDTRPLPCFHYNEDPEYLKFYVDRYDHITLGGMVPISAPQLEFWLDEIWDKYLTKSDGTPKIKVHGFGMTTMPLMDRYPWYSIDSSTWVQKASFGMILLPNRRKDLNISKESPTLKKKGKHLMNISKLEYEMIEAEIEGMGFTIEDLSTNYIHRWVWNLYAFGKVNEEITENERPFMRNQQALF
jgi:hypothetical protein